jgi:hypothetical protein
MLPTDSIEKPPIAGRASGLIASFSNSYARLPEHFFARLPPDDVAHVLTATTCTTYRAALAVAYGAGLRVSLKLNLIRNTQNVVQPRLPPSTALSG